MIFVTGGTGFIGSYIIKNLVEKGYAVRALRRSGNLPFYLPPSVLNRVEWVEGNLMDVVLLSEALKGVEAVIHAAALVSFHAGERRRMYRTNIEGTANLVNLALERGVKRLVHVSSVAALGRTATGDTVDETKKWVDSKINTHYAITKYHAEVEVWRGFAEGLEGVILNPSTVLGYGNWHQSSLAIFKNIYRGFPWYTKGINGFVGVEDVAEVAVRMLEADFTEKRFIVNAENRSFQHLFETIAAGFNKKPPRLQATPLMGALAWRLEKFKSLLTGNKPLLTRETAMVAHSQTYFDNSALLQALPGFQFQQLDEVVFDACKKYLQALESGLISP